MAVDRSGYGAQETVDDEKEASVKLKQLQEGMVVLALYNRQSSDKFIQV